MAIPSTALMFDWEYVLAIRMDGSGENVEAGDLKDPGKLNPSGDRIELLPP